mmetsp:Transcript_27675/g.42724  ORF Transcript_27675/g.42724 Transcript_27675/m.42724 type:complete len:578 (+) Transcript_27675:170-1903(+)|eukprot:CAMPEP_0194285138 /NCGR_PEP_ID=MMETSP0169-20130528/29462_1 /TAXON_ID=218684 /ORGANISM="Corethron pennatum, Strain L29A3" /LENGTH=577 /DNA_ID=CAMNT_0039031183 /DNA_START=107 /DNA_END=1840 /DNA_ORIENTATION=-
MSGLRQILAKQRGAAAAAALTAIGFGTWASIITANDDWDDIFPPTPAVGGTFDNGQKEKIVILGSGWAGLNALRKCAGPDKDVVIVSPRPHFLYTPLLAGSAVGTVTLRSACEPIRSIIAGAAGRASSATFVRADARYVDVANKRVRATTAAGEDGLELWLSYDKLVVAVGAAPNTFGIPGVKEHGLFLKEAEDSARLHARLLNNLERAAGLLRHGNSTQKNKYEDEITRLLRIIVVGGGPTGVELSAELADFRANDVRRLFGEEVADRLKIVLVEALPRILGPFDRELARVAEDHLTSRGVEVRTGTAVTGVKAGSATFQPSTPRSATPEEKEVAKSMAESEDIGCLVWAAGIGARPLVKQLASALGQTDLRGLAVDSSLRVHGAEGVFAIGDAALAGYAPTAQVAEKQGKHVGRSLRDGASPPFVYKHAGSLCCLGQGNGIAQLVAPSNSALNIWDALGAPTASAGGKKDEPDQLAVTGPAAWAMWRSLYWSKLLSNGKRANLSMDWMKSQFSGRDIIEPTLQRHDSVVAPAEWQKGGVSGGVVMGGRKKSVESFGTPLQRNSTIVMINKKGNTN